MLVHKYIKKKVLFILLRIFFVQESSGFKTQLSGYGVELAIKSQEYKAKDDTKVEGIEEINSIPQSFWIGLLTFRPTNFYCLPDRTSYCKSVPTWNKLLFLLFEGVITADSMKVVCLY